jgi:hypothetical protein
VRGSNFGSVTFGGADKILARALPA